MFLNIQGSELASSGIFFTTVRHKIFSPESYCVYRTSDLKGTLKDTGCVPIFCSGSQFIMRFILNLQKNKQLQSAIESEMTWNIAESRAVRNNEHRSPACSLLQMPVRSCSVRGSVFSGFCAVLLALGRKPQFSLQKASLGKLQQDYFML